MRHHKLNLQPQHLLTAAAAAASLKREWSHRDAVQPARAPIRRLARDQPKVARLPAHLVQRQPSIAYILPCAAAATRDGHNGRRRVWRASDRAWRSLDSDHVAALDSGPSSRLRLPRPPQMR